MLQSMLNSALSKDLEYKSLSQNPHESYIRDLGVPKPSSIWEEFDSSVFR